PIVHFAPEPSLAKRLQERYGQAYRTADLMRQDVELQLNIERIDLADGTVGTVMANHVLEHVDDQAALREIRRVLGPHADRRAILSFPIAHGWHHTYEDPSVVDPHQRELHFGQS